MADDKEDTQNKKDDVLSEKDNTQDKKEDAQVKNELGAIKARFTATDNPAELASLASAVAGLASSTNNPELLEQIKGVQAAIAKKEENAELKISSKMAAENLEALRQNPESSQEQIERAEQAVNIARYKEIKADFHKKLDEDLGLLDAAIDPSKATPEQTRILEDNLTPEEREEREKQQQLKKEGFANVYKIKENAEKEIKRNDERIVEIDKELKVTKEENKRKPLLDEKQQCVEANKVRKQELDEHVKVELEKRDKERAKLTELTSLKEKVEKCPQLAKREVKDHFKMHVEEYKKESEKDPNHPALKELYEIVRKVDLAEELGIDLAVQKIDSKQEVQQIDRKAEIDKLNKEYPTAPIPRKETDKIANITVHNLGYAEHAKIIAEKKQVEETKQQQTNKISAPSSTPSTPTTEAKKKGQGRG